MKNKACKGVTLVEVMVAIGVLGILVSVAAPSFGDMMNRRRVRAAAAEIATDLAYARSEASLRPQTVFLDFKSNTNTSCYTIQTYSGSIRCDCTRGPGLACPVANPLFGPSPELKTMQLAASTGVTFTAESTDWTTPGGTRQVDFLAPQMIVRVPNFAVNVVGGSVSLRVQMTRLGGITTCSPNGTFGGGVPTCQ